MRSVVQLERLLEREDRILLQEGATPWLGLRVGVPPFRVDRVDGKAGPVLLPPETLTASDRGRERQKVDRPRVPPGGLEREEPEDDVVMLRLIPPFLLLLFLPLAPTRP